VRIRFVEIMWLDVVVAASLDSASVTTLGWKWQLRCDLEVSMTRLLYE